MKIAYAPLTPSLTAPGDRRRFCFYAQRRGIDFELARPERNYDVVVVSQRADITAWSRYRPGRAKVVYDLIDSYLAVGRDWKSRGRGLVKFVSRENHRLAFDYRRAIEAMCRRADAVVCSTEEQRVDIAPLCSNAHIVLDHQSHLVRQVKRDYRARPVFDLVWEGLPYTLDQFEGIREVIARASERRPAAVHLVTDLEFRRYAGRFGRVRTDTLARRLFERYYLYQWNEALLGPIVTSCDLALVPLDLADPFARGKPENKLLLFWRMGMPALVSATPAYRRAMDAAGLDMACETPSEWLAQLERYMHDEEARREAGERGRAFAEEQHGDERLLERWDRVFESLTA